MLLALLVASCGHSDEPEETVTKRTILIYMVATNNLGDNKWDSQDLAEMDKAALNGVLKDNKCRLLVYRAGNDSSNPELMEIALDGKQVKHVALSTYSGEEGVSVSVERMRRVIADATAAAPAEHYSLGLWSHASGWAASLTTSDKAPRMKTFGDDNGHAMQLHELAQAIPDNTFDCLFADVCYFSTIEVAYELRGKFSRMLAYPTEVPGMGMPYQLTLPYLCKETADLDGALKATYDHYNAKTGSDRSFAGAVVDLSQMENLAEVCREIYSSRNDIGESILQTYNIGSERFFVDFIQYYTAMSSTEQQRVRLEEAYGKTVTSKYATPYIFSRLKIVPEHYSGLSAYRVGSSPGVNENYFHSLAWAKAIGTQEEE